MVTAQHVEQTVRRCRGAGAADRSWLGAIGGIVLIAVLGATALLACVGPGPSGGPRDIPLAVVGPQGAVEQVDRELTGALGEDAIAVDAVEDAQAARTAVEEQQARGALVLGRDGDRMLVASGAGPAVAEVLERIAGELPEQAGGPAVVEDLAPLPAGDARGVIPGAMLLPTALAGIGAAMIALTMLLGNPLSGAQAAPELLPGGWAEFGQALPPGAMVAALRAVAFFDGSGVVGPLAVLGVWAALGLLAMLLPARRRRPRGGDSALETTELSTGTAARP